MKLLLISLILGGTTLGYSYTQTTTTVTETTVTTRTSPIVKTVVSRPLISVDLGCFLRPLTSGHHHIRKCPPPPPPRKIIYVKSKPRGHDRYLDRGRRDRCRR